jgi:1-pyrroline-5-carboxylate dehydrogenase
VTTAVDRPPFRHEPGLDFRTPEQNGIFEEALERFRSGLGRSHPLVIGGEEVDRDETFASINPARPEEVIGRC